MTVLSSSWFAVSHSARLAQPTGGKADGAAFVLSHLAFMRAD